MQLCRTLCCRLFLISSLIFPFKYKIATSSYPEGVYPGGQPSSRYLFLAPIRHFSIVTSMYFSEPRSSSVNLSRFPVNKFRCFVLSIIPIRTSHCPISRSVQKQCPAVMMKSCSRPEISVPEHLYEGIIYNFYQ